MNTSPQFIIQTSTDSSNDQIEKLSILFKREKLYWSFGLHCNNSNIVTTVTRLPAIVPIIIAQ